MKLTITEAEQRIREALAALQVLSQGDATVFVAKWAQAVNPGNVSALLDELDLLRDRLELDPRHPYDGIDCRDEDIRQLEKMIEELRARADGTE